MLVSIHGWAWELWFLPRLRVNSNVSDTHPLLAGLPTHVSSEVSAHVLFPQTWIFFGGLRQGNPMDGESGGPQSIGSRS